jgi:transcriptional regulator with XRE-family HTH domain
MSDRLEVTSGEFEQEIGKLIRQEREKVGYSRKELAKETGYTKYLIQKIEEGKGITISQLANISKVFGLNNSFFLDKEVRTDFAKMHVRWCSKES